MSDNRATGMPDAMAPFEVFSEGSDPCSTCSGQPSDLGL